MKNLKQPSTSWYFDLPKKAPSYDQTLREAANNFAYDHLRSCSVVDDTVSEPGGVDISYSKDPEKLDDEELQPLVGAYLDSLMRSRNPRTDYWGEFIGESDDSNQLGGALVGALEGSITPQTLGEIFMQVAVDYHRDRIVGEFAKIVDEEAQEIAREREWEK